MTAPDGSIVSIQLTLDDRTGITLWAPPWTDDDDEEWQGFLGDGAKIIMFPGVDELFEFIATSDENDLSDHPGWPAVTKLTPAQLRPAEDNRYDLEGVYEWAAGDPDPATESSLANVVEMVLRIGEACEDGALRRLIGATPEYAELMNGDLGYTGREGAKAWSELGDVIADTWERALRRVAQWLEWRGDFPEAGEHDDLTDDDDRHPGGRQAPEQQRRRGARRDLGTGRRASDRARPARRPRRSSPCGPNSTTTCSSSARTARSRCSRSPRTWPSSAVRPRITS